MCYDRKKDRGAPYYAGAQVRFGDHVAAVCMRPASLREPWPVLNKPIAVWPGAGPAVRGIRGDRQRGSAI